MLTSLRKLCALHVCTDASIKKRTGDEIETQVSAACEHVKMSDIIDDAFAQRITHIALPPELELLVKFSKLFVRYAICADDTIIGCRWQSTVTAALAIAAYNH